MTYSHRLEHLGGDDDGLSNDVALGNHHLLSKEDLAGRDLDAEVTTGDHDTIRLLENIVKVGNTLFVLNLDDDLDVRAFGAQDGANVANIVARADERRENHVNAILHTEREIVLVFLGEGGEINGGLWKVHTLARGDVARVEGSDVDVGSINRKNEQRENSVVDVDQLARRGDFGEVGLN